jgi:hypothetical protein
MAMAEMMKILLAMKEQMKAEREADREERKAEREADREQSKADVEQILAKMEERMTATQAKTDMKAGREEMMQSVGEHQEVPREEAAVIPVRGRKRRHRGRKQAAGRHGEPKELTRGDRGSRKKLAAACRKVSRRATVAWRKRNIFRKSWTYEICGPQPEKRLPAVQDTGVKEIYPYTRGEARKEVRSRIDVGKARNAIRE